MKNRMLMVPVAAVGALALALTGCSGGSSGGGGGDGDPNAQFEFWSFTGINQKDSVDEYLKINPDAKVKLSEVGSTTETATALTAALAGGKVPDLVLIQNDDLPKFTANPDNFVDMRTLAGDGFESDYLDWAVSFATADNGSIIGVPTDVGGLAIAYRADMFEAAGLPTDPEEVGKLWSTWDDFIKVGKQYTEATGEPFVDNVDTTVWYAASNQVTEKYYSDDGDLIWDDNPQIKQAFDYATETYAAGISANIAAWSSGWAPGKANGAFAVTIAPSWLLSGLKNDAPDTAGKWRVTNVPGTGGNWGGSVLAIPARAAHPEAAWQYIETMQSPQAQTDHFVSTGTFPAATQALESDEVLSYTDDFFGDSKVGKVISDSVLAFPTFPIGPDEGAIQSGFLNALVELQSGNVSPDGAWDLGVKNVKAALGG